ncbi:MAG: hypothetical protein N4A46_01445, partial [Schleiferiaceae bacterium]|nr:hypothetical protein [Schleiferiaceae bacterium]
MKTSQNKAIFSIQWGSQLNTGKSYRATDARFSRLPINNFPFITINTQIMKTFKLLLLVLILPLVSLGQDYELRSVIVKNDNQTGGDYHVTVQVRAVSNGFVSASFSQAVVFDGTALSIETVGQS